MASVALIGGDGSGKTTVAKNFVRTRKLPSKYLYMGLSTLKSSPAFPTTLLIRYFKMRSYKNSGSSNVEQYEDPSFTQDYHHNPTKRSDIWHAIRSINYLIDVFYRQVFSWIYQLQGYLVIYDRHFLFMAAPGYRGKQEEYQHWIDQVLFRIFDRIYPKPNLVVFLDAPPEILNARKPEGKLDYLEKRRIATLEQGKKMKNFICIDTTQSLEKVENEFERIIINKFSQNREYSRGEKIG